MFKKPNSIASFIFSFGSIAILLDYLLWPRIIKANESFLQGMQIKIVGILVFLLLSLYFRSKAKINEKENGWLKASGIMNKAVFLFFITRCAV